MSDAHGVSRGRDGLRWEAVRSAVERGRRVVAYGISDGSCSGFHCFLFSCRAMLQCTGTVSTCGHDPVIKSMWRTQSRDLVWWVPYLDLCGLEGEG
jgi:hypothetical protein